LQIIIDILPVGGWIKLAIEAAWEIFQLLPWFHKAGAVIDLREAVQAAKSVGNCQPVVDWCERWQPMTTVANPPDLKK
jgi:hypothetical protein